MAKVLKGDFSRHPRQSPGDTGKDEPIPGYTLHVSLPFSDPLIWRLVQVPGSLTLAMLHRVIQACMGWEDSDSHQFLVGKIFYQPGFGIENNRRKPEYDEAKFQLYQLEEGMQFVFSYLYDGGDGWEVQIMVDEILAAGAPADCPVVLDGERACPPEAFGDIHQYQAALEGDDVLTADEGETVFDPERFELASINAILEHLPQ